MDDQKKNQRSSSPSSSKDHDHDHDDCSSSSSKKIKKMELGNSSTSHDHLSFFEPKFAWSDNRLKLVSYEKVREARLKLTLEVPIFFASFDQMNNVVSGEGACSAIAIVVSHWLLSNPNSLPTRFQLDSLIIQGSSEWRKLCNKISHQNRFLNNHFDIETLVEAGIRPLSIITEKSTTGFFGVEKFEDLKGHFSLDDMWEEITKSLTDEPKVFILGWNDHFFVMKLTISSYYIIDSLGGRLFARCNQAYILNFDESSTLYSENKIICAGKECCKEFLSKFMANEIVMELEEYNKKGCISLEYIYEKLQIDMHYMCLTTPSSPTLPSSSLLLHANP